MGGRFIKRFRSTLSDLYAFAERMVQLELLQMIHDSSVILIG